MEKKKWVFIPKSIIAISVFVLIIGGIYLYDKNLLPVGDVSLEEGRYEWEMDSSAAIIVTKEGKLKFENFDLNEKLKGGYVGYDLNEIFLGQEQEFLLIRGMLGVCSLHYNVTETDLLEIDYYPREDKLVLLKARSETGYSFVMK